MAEVSRCMLRRPCRRGVDKNGCSFYLCLDEICAALEELPNLTAQQRQPLIRQAIELENPTFSPADESLVQSRLEAHHRDPSSSISVTELKQKLNRRRRK